jgi:HK97 family phage portal protein
VAWNRSKTVGGTDTKALAFETSGGGGGGLFGGGATGYTGGAGRWGMKKSVKDGMQRVVWVYRCVDAIASSQADLAMVYRTGDRNRGPMVEGHPLYPILNSQTNNLEDAFQFRYRMSAQLLMSDRGVFVEVIRDKLGRVEALGLLPPDQVTPIADPVKFIAGFELALSNGRKIALSTDQVIWLKRPHPEDPFKSLTPMEAAGLSIDIDWLARVYNRSFLMNDGRPGGILVIKADMDPDDKDELRARFAGGPSRAGRVSVLAGEGADFVDTAVNPRDAQWLEMRKVTKEEILLAFGVPESQMGNASGRTYDNADAEDLVFWEKTMVRSHLGIVSRPFDVLDADPNTMAGFDLSNVPALQNAERRRLAALREDFRAGLISKDEYRLEARRDPVASGDGGRLYLPSSFTAVGDTTDPTFVPALPAPNPLQALGLAQQLELEGPKADILDVFLRQVGDALATRMNPHPQPDVDVSVSPPGDDIEDAVLVDPFAYDKGVGEHLLKTLKDREQHSELFVAMIRRFFKRQRKVVLEKLGGAKTRRKLAQGRKVDAGDVFDDEVWDRQLEDDAVPLITATVVFFAGIVAKRAGTTFDPTAPEVQRAIQKQIDRLLLSNDTTKDAIDRSIVAGTDASGVLDLATVRATIEDLFANWDGRRSEIIADWNTLAASNNGLVQSAVQGGVAAEKVWIAAGDDRVRDSHVEMDGTSVALDEPFDVGGAEMDYPGDPFGPPEETINCRCAVWFAAADGETPADAPGDLPTETEGEAA